MQDFSPEGTSHALERGPALWAQSPCGDCQYRVMCKCMSEAPGWPV